MLNQVEGSEINLREDLSESDGKVGVYVGGEDGLVSDKLVREER